jgi:ribonuclease Z
MQDCQAGDESFQTVFLGTGAACPSKYRNVTSIYLDFYERGGLLLDCGEATLGQLIRYDIPCSFYWTL